MKNIALFASGNGSNVENIVHHFRKTKTANVAVVFCNNPQAYVRERCMKLAIPCVLINKNDMGESKNILNLLRDFEIDFIVLAGYLSMIPDYLIHAFPKKIINVHPALLPKFGGKGMFGIHVHKAVIETKEKQTGITIHYVNEHYDKGEIIAQHTCEVTLNDTPETLAKKVQALELEYFPVAIEKITVN